MVTFFPESCYLLSKIEVRGPEIGFHNRKIEFLLQIFAFPLARRIKRQSAQINTNQHNQHKSTQIAPRRPDSTTSDRNATRPNRNQPLPAASAGAAQKRQGIVIFLLSTSPARVEYMRITLRFRIREYFWEN